MATHLRKVSVEMPYKFSARVTQCGLLVFLFAFAGCSNDASNTHEAAKPVKIEVIGNSSKSQTDHFIGTLRAGLRTDLGFESSGRISKILVDVGDRVRVGQPLATLDEAPARWRLEKAKADQKAAEAVLSERKSHLKQQEILAKDRIISSAALEVAQSSYQQAVSLLEAANTNLALSKRDLLLAKIVAPFDGVVVSRNSQPFTDVAAGQSILQLDSGAQYEVVTMIPDSIAVELSPGSLAHAVMDGQRTELRLKLLSGRSDNGSLVQAIFQVKSTGNEFRTGKTVRVELPRDNNTEYSLPMAAVIPENKQGLARVFVINPADGTLQSKVVQIGDQLLPEGRVAIKKGISAGDQIVVAGPSFLHEGQRVTPYKTQTVLHEIHQ